jgi:hypothetical protein
MVALAGLASAQFGFFDLEADDDTKFRGTTGDVVPQCFSMPSGFCGDGGRTVFTPDAKYAGLVASYDFDDAHGFDKSGHAIHPLAPPPDVGPGHDGRGQSAHFSGIDSFKIPHVSTFDNMQQMTISFWIYLLAEPTDSFRVITRKGDTTEDLTPTIMLLSDSNKIHALVSSTDPSKHGVDSHTAIPVRRWTHVAVALKYNVMTIFINGVKDNDATLTGDVLLNTGSWHIGKDNFLPGTAMYLDNLKIYSHALDEAALQVEASSALPGVGPNFLRLGCKSCPMRQAIDACAASGGYHLCRRLELNGGGLMVARAMGYLDMASEQWHAEDEDTNVNLEKLGLCCLD